MSDTSAILSLPYLLPAQAQKHVTHNEALQRLDILAQLTVAAIGTVTPPASPAQGETHIPGAGAEGAWTGHAGEIASFEGAGWVFVAPREGWRAFDLGTGVLHVHDAGAWAPVQAETQELDGIGIGTGWDAVNRLAVAADASLFSHAGAGHQVKVNKDGAGDTASLLFQSGWSGRAEMGLAGGDDFTVKVSDDGTSWVTALSVAAGSGHVGVGVAAPQRSLHVSDVLRLEPSSEPASGAAGDLYFDAGTNTLRCHDGTAWRALF